MFDRVRRGSDGTLGAEATAQRGSRRTLGRVSRSHGFGELLDEDEAFDLLLPTISPREPMPAVVSRRRDDDLGAARGRSRAAHVRGAGDDVARPATTATGVSLLGAAPAAAATVKTATAATAAYRHPARSTVTACASGTERARVARVGIRASGHAASAATGLPPRPTTATGLRASRARRTGIAPIGPGVRREVGTPATAASNHERVPEVRRGSPWGNERRAAAPGARRATRGVADTGLASTAESARRGHLVASNARTAHADHQGLSGRNGDRGRDRRAFAPVTGRAITAPGANRCDGDPGHPSRDLVRMIARRGKPLRRRPPRASGPQQYARHCCGQNRQHSPRSPRRRRPHVWWTIPPPSERPRSRRFALVRNADDCPRARAPQARAPAVS
jgi:hypothetical protein